MWKPLFVWKARTLWAIYEKKKCKKKWIAPERFHILFYYYRFYHLQGLGVVPALLPGFFGPKVVFHPGQVAGFRGSYRLFRSERIAHAMWFESGQCLVWFRVVHVTSPGAACCPTWWLPACCQQQEGLKRFFLSGKRRLAIRCLKCRGWAANIPGPHSRLVHHDGWDSKRVHFCTFFQHQSAPQRKYQDGTMAKRPDHKRT